MSDIYEISIGFSKPKKTKIGASAIMFIEDTNYSHTFITWYCDSINRRKVYEAVGNGSRKISNKTFKSHAHIVEIYKFKLSEEDLFKIDQLTHDESGTKYGYKHLLGLGWMRVVNKLYRLLNINKKIGNPFKDGKYSQICTEAASYVIELFNKQKLPGDIEDYGLKEFHEFIDTYGTKVSQSKINKINKS